ncbi:MAG: hypothetical protein WCB19_11060 [Thermoplasmata archaeon]
MRPWLVVVGMVFLTLAAGTLATLFLAGLSLEFDLLVGAGAAGLFLVGVLAIFLGLFLRGDPYGPRLPLVSRSADDADEMAQDDPSDH